MNTPRSDLEIPVVNTISRKVLHRSINLAFRDSLRLQARTLDISPVGITMMSPLQIAGGRICDIRFDVPLDGEFPLIQAVSQSVHSICVGTQGFRTHLRFIEIDASCRKILSNLMRSEAY